MRIHREIVLRVRISGVKKMEFDTLANIIFKELSKIIAEHDGLEVFVVERAKFEGWVKVELTRILKRYFKDIIPEKEGIDIVADDLAIEIKTINTNYSYFPVKNKHKPITKNMEDLLEDIEKLKNTTKYRNKIVFFIVFPMPESAINGLWQQKHLSKIQSNLRRLVSHKFKFKNNVPGIMYLGQI